MENFFTDRVLFLLRIPLDKQFLHVLNKWQLCENRQIVTIYYRLND